MEKGLIVLIALVTVLAMTIFLYGVLNAVAPTTTPAATTVPTPVATPVPTSSVPTPDVRTLPVPVPVAMTAEEFYKKLYAGGINQGASVVITDTVADKEKGNAIFQVFVRGEMAFGIYVQLEKSDFAKIKIGEIITVGGRVLTMSNRYAILSDVKLQ